MSASLHHICAPLLSIAQQSQERAIFVDEWAATSPSHGGPPHQPAYASATGVEVARRVALLSRALSTCIGIAPGDVVVLVAHTSAAMLETLLASLDAGAIVCPVNWRWSASELAEAISRVSPKLVLFDGACAPLTLEAASALWAAATGASASPGAGQPVPTAPPPGLCLIDHWPGGLGPFGSDAGAPPLTTSRLLSAFPEGPPSSNSDLGQPALQLLAPPCGTALLVFTSGTTAAPKGVQLSHSAFHSQSMAKLVLLSTRPGDTYLHLAPLFHIGGLSSAFAALLAGAVQVFVPRFEAEAALAAMVRHRVTSFIAVPTMLQDLAAVALSGASAPSGSTAAGPFVAGGGAGSWSGGLGPVRSVTRILVGAGATPPSLQEAVGCAFPCAELVSAYGMTEACSSMTFRHLRRPAAAPPAAPPSPAELWAPPPRPSAASAAERGASDTVETLPPVEGAVCVGLPAPGVQVAILATEAEHESPGAGANAGAIVGDSGRSRACVSSGVGETAAGAAGAVRWCGPLQLGEVVTRGPHVMVGYWRDPAATQQALLPGGWLRTGDLGLLAPGGSLWLLGRAKDMVKSGGENVFAPHVEAALLQHPAVAAAAVVGLPHERLGEQVAALVVLRPGWAFRGPCLPQDPNTTPFASTSPASDPGRETSGEELREHCRAVGLAGFRLPRFVAATHGPLPATASGKVAKARVRAALEEAARGAAAQGQGLQGGLPRSRL
ncbi:hypothetical protein HYH03_006222 [Edaphochlamys debaryana]|uniref:Uncharacterized protein n=1 Tax=Edaphochlamys debaryana TaxID=47281 RepID=A0A835Y5R8_9CHLO|nr:hypothetical protein HYH03_006222 [Edaphochlamys debaryana]|eukprot:KAG2495622.1 hypothetical protein HYH03_006222 [Edaphochlamys debaryana]